MNLLLAADTFPPQSSGPATYVVALANELVKRGVAVSIISLNPQSDRSAVSCSTYHVSSGNKLLRYLEYLYLLLREVKKADVIYAMGPVNAGLPAWLAARLRRKKFVVKVVGDYAWEQGVQRFGVSDLVDPFQKKKYGLRVELLRLVQKTVVRAADQVITPCQYLRAMVIGWGAKEEKVAVIYNAVEVLPVEPAPKPAGESWLVSVGRLVPWKGMQTLIALMPEITRIVPQARLKIVGDGPEMEKLKSEITNQKLTNVVALLGNLSRGQTLAYMRAADVVVLNSGYEGLSHVILEAFGQGKQILASAVGGNPEFVIPKNTGELFPYNDREEIKKKIIAALANTAPIEFWYASNEGHAFLKKFQLSVMIGQTQALLASLIS